MRRPDGRFDEERGFHQKSGAYLDREYSFMLYIS
jgi:hypothetical protein